MWKWPENTIISGNWRGIPTPGGVIVWHEAHYPDQWDSETREFWGVTWEEPAPVSEPAPPPPRIISGNDLVRRFLAINPAAVVDIEHSQVPEIIIGRKLVETAREGIDLDSPETAYYMGLLVLEGIITEAERSQILNLEEE